MATKLQLDSLKLAIPLAQAAEARFGVPASITLAQWALESRWGQSQLAVKANNFFGVKAIQGEAYSEFPTREVLQGRALVELQHFAFYPTPAESFIRHAQLLASLPRYEAFLMFAREGNLGMACQSLASGGYSTDPGYAQGILAIIREFDLTQYDGPISTQPNPAT